MNEEFSTDRIIRFFEAITNDEIGDNIYEEDRAYHLDLDKENLTVSMRDDEYGSVYMNVKYDDMYTIYCNVHTPESDLYEYAYTALHTLKAYVGEMIHEDMKAGIASFSSMLQGITDRSNESVACGG